MPLWKSREEREKERAEEAAEDARIHAKMLKRDAERDAIEAIFDAATYEGTPIEHTRLEYTSDPDARRVLMDLRKNEHPDDLVFIEKLDSFVADHALDARLAYVKDPYGHEGQKDASGRPAQFLQVTFWSNGGGEEHPSLMQQYKAIRAKMTSRQGMVECPFCGMLYSGGLDKCPHCGAPKAAT